MRDLSPLEEAAKKHLLALNQKPDLEQFLPAQLGLWGLDNLEYQQEYDRRHTGRARQLMEELNSLEPEQAQRWLEQDDEMPAEWLEDLSQEQAAGEIILRALTLDGAFNPTR